MTRQELTEALDRYGGDLRLWPAALGAEGEALIAADPDAAQIAASVRGIEANLKALTAPAPLSHSDVRRIVTSATRGRTSPAPVRMNRLVAACSAAAVVAFFAAGFVAGFVARDDGADAALAALVFGASPIGTEQLL